MDTMLTMNHCTPQMPSFHGHLVRKQLLAAGAFDAAMEDLAPLVLRHLASGSSGEAGDGWDIHSG